MPIEGVDLIAKNIVKFTNGFIRSTNRVMKEVEVMIDQEVMRNMSLTDHSLQDLAKLGHPYSAKNNVAIHSPDWLVHTQSGRLLSAKSSGVDEASVEDNVLRASAFVQVDPDIAEHAVYVIYGTSKMVPRPFLRMSKDIVAPDAVKLIKDKLKFLKVE